MTDLSTGNHLFYGDNLDVLRDLPDGFVDLVYLDPPFNSNARDDVRARGGLAQEEAKAKPGRHAD